MISLTNKCKMVTSCKNPSSTFQSQAAKMLLFSSSSQAAKMQVPCSINKVFLGPYSPSLRAINNNFKVVFSTPSSSSSCPIKNLKGCPSYHGKSVVVRASTDSYSNDDFVLLPPLQLKSSVGQLLEEILQTKPHLFSAAVDEQRLKLRADKTISEKEKCTILEELIYCSIVRRFKESNISMIREISAAFDPTLIHPDRWEITHYPKVPWGSLESKLETIHTPEDLECMYGSIIDMPPVFLRHRSETQDIKTRFSKSQLRQFYVDSVIYAYSLKRIKERYELERSMNLSTSRWKIYLLDVDKDSFSNLSHVRSMEAFLLIGKHVGALFGWLHKRGSTEENDKDHHVLTFRELNLVILEALAFGAFLGDEENYVNS